MRYIYEWLTDIRALLRATREALRKHLWYYLLLPVPLLAGSVFVFFHDAAITRTITTDWHIRFWWFYAGELCHYGAFERGTILITAILLVMGYLKKNHAWRRAAVACLLACLLAGITANVLKCTTGRPRPNAGVTEDGFHGLKTDNNYKSFPSAHSATSVATAACLSVVFPAISVPLYLFEGGVALSRVYVKGHYLSDVMVGSMIGIWFGSLVGIACRRLNRQIPAARTDSPPDSL